MPSTKNQKTLSVAGLAIGCFLAGGLAEAALFETTYHTRTARQLAPFAQELTRWSSMDSAIPETLETMVGSTSITMVGELVAVAPGRKEFLAMGCDAVDDSTGNCTDVEKGPIFASHANLVVRPTSILRGELDAEDELVNVEIDWPINVGVDALASTFPHGTRVIIIGSPVKGAKAAAAPLVALGIAKEEEVGSNLVGIPPYGFIMESAEGVLAPMWGDHPLVEGDSATVFASFETAVAALEEAAPNAVERKPLPPDVTLPMGASVY